MKKITLILLVLFMLVICLCRDNKKYQYLPEAKNDKVYTTIGGENESHKTKKSLEIRRINV